MTFTPNIPSSGQSLGFTRPLVNGNFTSLYNTIAENHYPPNDPLDGKHQVAVFPEQTVFPATVANECETFSREFNSRTELMYRPENTAAGDDQWALSGVPFRGYITFDGSGALGAKVALGRSFNLSINKDNATATSSTYTATFTTQFPIGAPANPGLYGVLINASTSSSGSEARISAFTDASFTFTVTLPNPTRVTVLVMGG